MMDLNAKYSVSLTKWRLRVYSEIPLLHPLTNTVEAFFAFIKFQFTVHTCQAPPDEVIYGAVMAESNLA